MEKKNKSYDIEDLSAKCVENIRQVLESLDLDVKYYVSNDSVTMPCPIHGGDNPQGFSILLRGVGNWRCFTHNCHEQYGSPKGASLISFVQAVKKLTFAQTLDFLGKLFGIVPTDDYVQDSLEKKTFIKNCKILNLEPTKTSEPIPRRKVRNSLHYPVNTLAFSAFSNYSPIVLDSYDIGQCKTKGKAMFGRVVVPFYDETGQFMLGCAGRTLSNLCQKCKLYHDDLTLCPITCIEKASCCKWKNSWSFSAEGYLYNLWKAKNVIEEKGSVILVEGPGDVWKLEEAGIHNSLALLGVKFTEEQKILLEGLGATSLIIGTDNDESGLKARARIRESCKRMFNIVDVIPLKKDFGDSSVEEIRTLFKDYF